MAGQFPRSPKKRRSLVIALVALGLALALAGTVVAGSDSEACAGCHPVAATAMSTTSHAFVDCYDCHLSSGAWSYPAFKSTELFRMYPAALLGKEAGAGPAARTSPNACTTCHFAVLKPKELVVARGLRIVHDSCAGNYSTCDSCHPDSGHGEAAKAVRGPVMGECVDCHKESKVSVECETCHTADYEREALLEGPFRQTHGADWRTTHGMGDLQSCSLCHSEADCIECHGIPVPHSPAFGVGHGEAVKSGSRDSCQTCHVESFCSDCHGTEMPHPADFLARHSSVAEGVSDPACVRCHLEEDCLRCHERHVHPGAARGVPVPRQIPKPGDGQ